MYNVGKVGRGAVLAWFNEIFDALTKVFATDHGLWFVITIVN
jgi:Vacuolar 14 Fab1-binding region